MVLQFNKHYSILKVENCEHEYGMTFVLQVYSLEQGVNKLAKHIWKMAFSNQFKFAGEMFSHWELHC